MNQNTKSDSGSASPSSDLLALRTSDALDELNAMYPSTSEIAKTFMRSRLGDMPFGGGKEHKAYLEKLGMVFDAMDYYANREWEK